MNYSKPRKVAIYARVSTSSQTVENQFQELREVAKRNWWNIVAELSDSGISGARTRGIQSTSSARDAQVADSQVALWKR